MIFEELGLSPEVLRAVGEAGYTEPTPIQEKAIPIALQGRDLLGCAQTGTGKTAAFTLPMIDILAGGKAKARMPRSLILTPTRELATQISENFEIYGKYHKLTMALLIGGVSISEQEKALGPGVDVLIATPGRLLDLFERGRILLNGVKILVIDEADRMLDMGFIPDVQRIVSLLPRLRQTLFFSATLQPEIRKLGEAFLHNPREVRVAPPTSPAENVNQALARVAARDKGKALRALLTGETVQNALIFCNRKRDVDTLSRSLKSHGLKASALHGDMPQPARTETLEAFKRGDIRFLVATDVAGRGIDIFGLSHVFNFDVPIHAEDYIHRIGRTGRAGHRGRAITLASPDEAKYLSAIQKLIGRNIPVIEAPGVAEPAEQECEAEKPKRSSGRGRRRKPDGAERKSDPRTPREPRAGAKSRTAGRDTGKTERVRSKKPGPAAREKSGPAAREKDVASRGPVVGLGDHMPDFLLPPGQRGRK